MAFGFHGRAAYINILYRGENRWRTGRASAGQTGMGFISDPSIPDVTPKRPDSTPSRCARYRESRFAGPRRLDFLCLVKQTAMTDSAGHSAIRRGWWGLPSYFIKPDRVWAIIIVEQRREMWFFFFLPRFSARSAKCIFCRVAIKSDVREIYGTYARLSRRASLKLQRSRHEFPGYAWDFSSICSCYVCVQKIFTHDEILFYYRIYRNHGEFARRIIASLFSNKHGRVFSQIVLTGRHGRVCAIVYL